MTSQICVIPARAGSVGVPGKNVAEVEGISLVSRSFLHSRIISPEGPVLLTTDSQEIVEVLAETAGVAPPCIESIEPGGILETPEFLLHRRLPEEASSSARIAEVLQSIRDNLAALGKRFDAWLLLQPTSPFRSRIELLEFRQRLAESNDLTSIVSVKDVDDIHPARMYSMTVDHQLVSLGLAGGLEMANRQELPTIYIRDGGFYVIGDALVRDGKQFSEKPIGVVREFPWTVNIDKPEDLLLARLIGSVEGEAIGLGE